MPGYTDDGFENSVNIPEILLAHKCTYRPYETCRSYEEGRSFCGFVLPLSGSADYFVDGVKRFTAGVGDVLYLPARSKYVVVACEGGFVHYTVNFLASCHSFERSFKDGLYRLFADEPTLVKSENFDGMKRLMSEIVALFSSSDYGSTLLCKARLFELTYLFFSELQNRESVGADYALLEKVKGYIDENYARPITSRELSALSSMSETNLRRKFRRYTGLPPLDYQSGIRIRKAKELLLSRELPVAEVARAVGFEDANYFSRFFKKRVGISPAEFARM